MEVLLAFARRPGEVIPKSELIGAVWGNAFVSDEVLTHAIWDLRRAFGDQASDPEFIQTIPKRGYRLIAPVKNQAAEGGGSPARPFARLMLWGIAAVAIALMIGFRVARKDTATGHFPAAGPGGTLVLEPTDAPAELEEAARTLDRVLRNRLTGIPDVDLHLEAECRSLVGGETTWCLQPILISMTDSFRANGVFREEASEIRRYATPTRTLFGRSDLEPFARELAEMTAAFLEVMEDQRFGDRDLSPWLSLQGRDIRAVRDFLLGVEYVYRNEIGGRHPMDAAIDRDPDFIAPRVWRTPSMVTETDGETLARHRAVLDRLYANASAFEKAMISWAIALIDGNPADQIKQLRVALAQESENRPVRFVLGAMLANGGDLEDAWRLIQPLVEQSWRFPGLYPVAAEIAIQRDRIDDIRKALESALTVATVDPEALAVMILLAIYDEDAQSEELFTKKLELRRREIAPEDDRTLDVSSVAEALAARAEAEGRAAIADRLRDSAARFRKSAD